MKNPQKLHDIRNVLSVLKNYMGQNLYRGINKKTIRVSRWISAFLIAQFILLPYAPVFAQTDPGSTIAPASDSSGSQFLAPAADTSGSQPTDSNSQNGAGSSQQQPTGPLLNNSQSAPASPDAAASPPITDKATLDASAISAAKLVADQKLSPLSGLSSIAANKWLNSYGDSVRMPQPSSITGAFTYGVPIVTPPGRAGVQPDLKLSYNSQDKSNEDLFGFGWSINIPYIERMDKNGINNIYNQTYFTSTLDADLASTSATTYGAKSDDGSMRQYTLSTSTSAWTMVDKQGTQYMFGSSTTARIYNASSTSQIYRWMLEKVQDTNGNSMTYTYTQDGGQVYPSSITYTTNGTSSPAFEVDFVNESRTQTNISYRYGFQVQTAKRIKEIDVKFNGNLVSKYVLAFGTGFDGVRDLLQSVTLTGYDESGTPTTPPATTFTYQTEDTSWPSSNPSPFNLPDLVDNGKDTGFRIFHALGNVGSDFVLATDYQGVTLTAYEAPDWNNVTSVVGNIPALVSNVDKSDLGVAFTDVNGDGYADIVKGKLGSYNEVWLHPFLATTSETNIPSLVDAVGNDLGVRFGDFNGDGYADYIVAVSGTTTLLFLNKADGTGWANGTTTNLGIDFVDSSGNDTGARVMDVNGDGVDDIVKYATGDASPTIYINTGNGIDWVTETSGISGIPLITGTGGKDIGTRIMDIDGDGLADFVVSTPGRGIHFYINEGDGKTFTEQTINTIPYFLDSTDTFDIGTRVMDGNIDGIPDFVTSSTSTKADYLSSGHPVDALKTVTLPAGGTISVTYTGAHVYSTLLQVVNTITTDPKLSGTPVTNTYSFLGGVYQTLFQDRKFAGFEDIDMVDSLGNYTRTFYHQGNGDLFGQESTIGEYNDIEAKMFHPFRIEKRLSPSPIYSLAITKWDSKDLGNGRTLVFPSDTLNFAYDGLSTHRDSGVVYDYATSTGNVILKTELGEVTAANDGTFTDLTNTDNRISNYSYATSTNSYLTGLPSDQTRTDYLGTKVNETRTYYDNLALGTAAIGNATKQELWKTGTSYASSTKSYNSIGLVTQFTDGRGAATTQSYDPFNLYVATSTNTLGQVTAYLYNYSSGNVKQKTDPNGFVYQTTYDGLNRPLQDNQPDLTTPTTLVTADTYSYTDTALAVSTLKTAYLNPATTTTLYTYQDGLNRTIQTRALAEGTNTYTVKDSVFDSRGLLQKDSLPYFASSTALSSPTVNSNLYLSYAYDLLQRPTTVANALGTTTTAYANWKLTTTDANGKSKDVIKDAFGNLANVVEHIGTTTATTTYAWNLNNKLTNITDALANVRNFTYDGLGRQLTAQDLHASGDTTYGTSTYAYDDSGNLTQKIDPKNQTVNYGYDALNRLLTEDYTGQSGTEITNTYDSCTNGKMHLCSASSTGALVQYGYNPLGSMSIATSTIIGTTTPFVMQYAYDRQGDQTAVTYPDNAQVQYIYDSAGRINTVQEKENNSTFKNVLNQFGYSPLGQVTSIGYANGVTTTNIYDSNSLYRLTSKVSILPSTLHAQDLSYTYDPVGNITQIVDNSDTATKKTTNYTYDDLSRLLTASTTNATSSPNYKYTYTYDVLGNITSGPLGAYAYTGNTGSNYANPDAVTSIGSTTMAYDQNGNLKSEATSTYSWSYRNQLTQSGNGIATSTYSYDDQNSRVSLTEASTTTLFPNNLYDAVIGGSATSTKHIFANGLLIATIENSATSTTPKVTSTSTPAFVQGAIKIGAASVTLGSSVTTGNLIVIGLSAQNTLQFPSNAITDNKGNTYKEVVDKANATHHIAIYYAANVSGGSSFTASTSVTAATISIQEYTGVATSSPLDKFNSSTGLTTTLDSGSVTVSTSSELYFGAGNSITSGTTWTAGVGYTLREQATTTERQATEDRVINTATTTSAKFTISGSSDTWAACYRYAGDYDSRNVDNALYTQRCPWRIQCRYRRYGDHCGDHGLLPIRWHQV